MFLNSLSNILQRESLWNNSGDTVIMENDAGEVVLRREY
jgi:hypothetical protein